MLRPAGSFPPTARQSARLLAAAGMLAALAQGPGCSTDRPSQSAVASAAAQVTENPLEVLRARARREETQPDTRSLSLPPPPGAQSQSDPAAELPPQARLSWARALEVFTPELAPPASLPELEVDESNADLAARAYARGREAMIAGDAAKALVELQGASRLNPTSPAIWRQLGEVQMRLGRHASAIASLRQAARHGLRDARVLLLIGRDALRTGQDADALRTLAAARGALKPADAPALGTLIDAELGQALHRGGYLAACVELLESALQTPVPIDLSSAMRDELLEFSRRRGELWQLAGDTALRLGEVQRAMRAYANAGTASPLTTADNLAKRVHGALRLGRTADAALLVLEGITTTGTIEERHIALVRFLSDRTDAGPLMDAALARVSPGAGAAAASRLARVRAAALPQPRARELLRKHLRSEGVHDAAVRDLLRTFSDADARGRVRELATLTRQHPVMAERFAVALLIDGRAIAGAVGVLNDESSPETVLLRAFVLDRLGLGREALDRWPGSGWTADLLPHALAAKAQIAARNGRWDQAREAWRALEQIQSSEDAVLRARAAALRSLQRFDQALAVLEPVLRSTPSTDDLLALGAIALDLGDAPKAERYFRQAVQTDPASEQAYESLIGLYAPDAALASEHKLGQTARELLRVAPSSRFLRWLGAQDLGRRGLWTQARSALLELVSEDPGDFALLDALVRTWEATATPDNKEPLARGERWLREQLETRPDAPALLAGLARVLAAQGRAQESVDLLTARTQRWPIPSLLRRREAIIASALNRPEQARASARERLGGRGLGTDEILELAGVLLDDAATSSRAAPLISEQWPPAAAPTASQREALLALTTRASQGALASPPRVDSAAALGFFDVLAERGVTPPLGLQTARLLVLSLGDKSGAAKIDQTVGEIIGANAPLARVHYVQLRRAMSDLTLGEPARSRRVLPALEAILKRTDRGEELLTDYTAVLANLGEIDDVRRFVGGMEDSAGFTALLAQIETGDGEAPRDLPYRRAELAYLIGNIASSRDRRDLANAAYRYTLELNPAHGMAANNLAYSLIEQDDGDLEHAQRLLEHSLKEHADDTNVLDSLGWLRYKQGVLLDVTDESGGVVREGAISLLERAMRGIDGVDNPVILDHAGDASWRAGRREQAKKYWTEALQFAQRRLALHTSQKPTETPAALKELQQIARGAAAKLAALSSNKEPPVAPSRGVAP